VSSLLRFGALGAALITPRALVYPCLDEPAASIYSIAARDRARAEAFAQWHRIPKVLDSYAEVVTHPKVDAVYNALPITAHREWTLAAIKARKHVLCEKSFASNAAEAKEMAEAADDADVVVMDAFHYRYHPIFIRAKEIYESGELGEIGRIAGVFHIPVTDPGSIRMRYELGGGVTMDIGCYPISWVRHITGLEPELVTAQAEEGPPNVDVMLKTEQHFANGVVATTSGDMRAGVTFEAWLEVIGSEAIMRVNNPLVPQNGAAIEIRGSTQDRVETFDRRPTYGYQLDAFLAAVHHGKSLFTDAWDGYRQMVVIDRAYEAAGLPVRGLQL
jgi:predicted dehydrogenase